MKTKAQKRQAWTRFSFLVYGVLMLWLLFGQRMENGRLGIALGGNRDNLNLIPFETLGLYWRLLKNGGAPDAMLHAAINLVGNVVMFVPLGWFLPKVWPVFRGLFRGVIFGASLICLVEMLQYITNLGSCDIDDLILNTVGVLLGYCVWKLKHKK